MAQEFTIKSQQIEDKINQLLPSQGGFQPGVDFSASTMVIPIVDLTETAEGSSLRQDLQTASGINGTSVLLVNATNTVIINTTGYYSVRYVVTSGEDTLNKSANLNISDGTTTTEIVKWEVASGGRTVTMYFNDTIVVYLKAGEELRGTCDFATKLFVYARQIADINGNLINP